MTADRLPEVQISEAYQNLLLLYESFPSEEDSTKRSRRLTDGTVINYAKLVGEKIVHLDIKKGETSVYFSIDSEGLIAFGFKNLPLILSDFSIPSQADVSIEHLSSQEETRFRKTAPTLLRWLQTMITLQRFLPPPLVLS